MLSSSLRSPHQQRNSVRRDTVEDKRKTRLSEIERTSSPQTAVRPQLRRLRIRTYSQNKDCEATPETAPFTLPSFTDKPVPLLNQPRTDSLDEKTAEKISSRIWTFNFKDVQTLGTVMTVREALEMLITELHRQKAVLSPYRSGLLRLEVRLPNKGTPLDWLKQQNPLLNKEMSFYFRPRAATPLDNDQSMEMTQEDQYSFCGIGHSCLWKGNPGEELNPVLFEEMCSILDPALKAVRCVGGTRFNCRQRPDTAWAKFGSFVFFLPAVEYHEGPGYHSLACTIAWNQPSRSTSAQKGVQIMSTLQDTIKAVSTLLQQIQSTSNNQSVAPHVVQSTATEMQHTPSKTEWKTVVTSVTKNLIEAKPAGSLESRLEEQSAMKEYLQAGQQGLDAMLTATHMSTEVESFEEDKCQLSKLVLARETRFSIQGDVNPHAILQQLQENDPLVYQFCVGMPNGDVFLGLSPERLYRREGNRVITEAVAGTRPRGPKGNLEMDFLIGLEMMRNPKDHVEFTLVRDWLLNALESICTRVRLDVHKSVIRKAAIQHLYGRLSGTLRNAVASDLEILNVLHPTPAICGRPQGRAIAALMEIEGFDRGYYSGPLGWISGNGSEFIVAIRSGLLRRNEDRSAYDVSLFSGVGIVAESKPDSEWQELELKIRPFLRVLSPRVSPFTAPDVNLRAAMFVVEELCRSGVHMFGVAPGSRSSPLVYAAATHPHCHVFTCIDERSLGFWGVGVGRATAFPAVIITSSGTAVGNLLPAVIEANQSNIPLLILTADRPSRLRQSGANQTIDQVKIFGGNVRYFHDIPPPTQTDAANELRGFLTMVDAALRHCLSDSAGPVHLNFQFDEPLAASKTGSVDMQNPLLEKQWRWNVPFTTHTRNITPALLPETAFLTQVLNERRGLLVIGELLTAEERVAAANIAEKLSWPCIIDVLSGLRPSTNNVNFIIASDHILAIDQDYRQVLQPNLILHMGRHLTSKRLMQFLKSSRLSSPDTRWISITADCNRDDPEHLVTDKWTTPLPSLLHCLENNAENEPTTDPAYLSLWKAVDTAVCENLQVRLTDLGHGNQITEPFVSYILGCLLPSGHGLFLGNSMVIRDMNMFGGNNVAPTTSAKMTSFLQVAANRGASGIDGVVSTAIGYAAGLKLPVTLLIGDVSFLHDSNGLSFLRNNDWPPMTIIINNNGGGGIFDFLPIADSVPCEMFDTLWSTPQYVSIEAICQAYGVSHTKVTRPQELQKTLSAAWMSHQHSIIEVITDRAGNVKLHQNLLQSSAEVGKQMMQLCSHAEEDSLEISDLSWSTVSYPLKRPITTEVTVSQRDCVRIRITLRTVKGSWIGIGEAAPLPGRHSESVETITAQLRYLKSSLTGRLVPWNVCLLNGTLNNWWQEILGVMAKSLSPSLRFGIDSALLTAISHRLDQHLHDLYFPSMPSAETIETNALIGSITAVENGVKTCNKAIENGFKTVKIKVGRHPDPTHEASIINSISAAFGDRLSIRLDANRAWSLNDAITFANALNCRNLEYIEEPVAEWQDLKQFIELTNLPCALDETIETCSSQQQLSEILQSIKGIGHCILKPSRIGSIDDVVRTLEICSMQNCRTVISSAFESPYGLAMLSEIAAIADNITCRSSSVQLGSIPHGLSTLEWFDQQFLSPLEISSLSGPTLSLSQTRQLLKNEQKFVCEASPEENVSFHTVDLADGEITFSVREVGYEAEMEKPVLLLLHGFLGDSTDWLPVMHFLSQRFHCVAIDLPGHGQTRMRRNTITNVDDMYLFENVVKAIANFVLDRWMGVYGIVGYSLGGRLGARLALAIDCPNLFAISSSLGIEDPSLRAARFMQDLDTAEALKRCPSMEKFLRSWYDGKLLWKELRKRSAMYEAVIRSKAEGNDPVDLAKALIGMSIGRMKPLAELLAASGCRVQFFFGSEDEKYVASIAAVESRFPLRFSSVVIDGCSHALIVEAGLLVATRILKSC